MLTACILASRGFWRYVRRRFRGRQHESSGVTTQFSCQPAGGWQRAQRASVGNSQASAIVTAWPLAVSALLAAVINNSKGELYVANQARGG